MEFKPHPYQRLAIDLILNNPAIALFLKPGLGKTSITLAAINDLMYDYFLVRKVLVIAPLRVASVVWEAEAAKWDGFQHLTLSKVLGTEQQRLQALEVQADIYTINRENVKWVADLYGRKWPFDMIVIDESQGFRHSGSQRFRALRRVRPLANRVLELTGTPNPNGYMDLWSQLYLLDRGERLGTTLGGYRMRYFEPDKQNGRTVFSWKPQKLAIETIQDKIRDICYSMDAKDWLDLPEEIHNYIKVPLVGKAREDYEQLESELLLPYADGEGDIVALTAATLSGKLLQMSNGAVYDENQNIRVIHDGKLDALEELIDSLAGEPLLVFYWFRHDLARILERLPKSRPLKTAIDIEDWNAGKIPVCLVHPASAGRGLNLQDGGHNICWFGSTWDAELYEQANARLQRQGQKNTVFIHHLMTEGTIDDDVLAALGRKGNVQAALMEAVKQRIGEVEHDGKRISIPSLPA